jgi:hypothetical protein
MPYYNLLVGEVSSRFIHDPFSGKSQEISDLLGGTWIESSEPIKSGSVYDANTNTWTIPEQPDPDPIYEYKKYQAGQWMQTLTTPELDAIYTMRSTTPSIDRMIDYVKLNGIDFNKETHRLEMHNLKAAGVFDSDRVDELLGYHQIN